MTRRREGTLHGQEQWSTALFGDKRAPMSLPSWIPRRLSLRLTLVLIVVLPLGGSMAVTVYAVLSSFERYTEGRMEEDVELVARSLETPISRALQRDRDGAVEEALRSAFDFNRVYGAYLYDEEGTLTAAIGSDELTTNRARLSELAEEGSQQGEYDQLGGREVYSYFVPLSTPTGQNAGLLQVVRRAGDIDRAVASLRWTAGVVFLITVVLISGLVLWGHRLTIGAPLARLREDMTKVEEGSRALQTSPSGPSEIAALGAQFETMVQSIEEAEEEIREQEAEKHRLEEKLQRAEKLAALGRLSAGVAHELGTPLSVIDGHAQRALRQDALPDPVAGALENIRGEVRRVEHIVNQLLDFGRRNPLQRRDVPASQVARIALEAAREGHSGADHGGADRLELSAPDAPVSLPVDVGLMERALANLLENALEASPDGPVRLSWHADEDHVVFSVEDGGPGIDPDVKPRLFEPFFTTKEVGEGTGLGLAVAHGIAEEHGGTIEMGESTLGGACFRVRLPKTPPSETPASRLETTT